MSDKMTGNYGKTVVKMKMLFVVGMLFIGTPNTANAQKFNSLISNPFAFCSAPKPCRHCHPWRAIYNEICANQIDPSDTTEKYEPSPGTEILETVDPRTVNGRGIRAASRIVSGDVSLNGGGTVEGLEVINRGSGERPVEGLEVINGPIREAQVR